MYFLLYLPLHKRQALSPIEEKSHSAERKRIQPRKGASAHAAPQEIPAHAASEELLRTAALKGNRRARNAGMHQPPQELRYKLN